MGLLGLFRKKEDKDTENAVNIALAETTRPETNRGEEELNALSRTWYMMTSPDVDKMFFEGVSEQDSLLKMLYPAFAGVNRTAKIGKKDAKILMIDFEILKLLAETNMKESEFNTAGWIFLESMMVYARGIVADMMEGWKGTLLTEQVKVLKTTIETKKKGGLFG